MTAPNDLAALDRGRYLRLTTFKRDGTAVHTPVWFAVDGDSVVVWTEATSGKAKRIRNRAGVEVAPCDGRGRVKGPARTGTARLVSDDVAMRRGHDVLNRKYPVKRPFEWVMEGLRIVRRRPEGTDVIIEVTLDPVA